MNRLPETQTKPAQRRDALTRLLRHASEPVPYANVDWSVLQRRVMERAAAVLEGPAPATGEPKAL